MSGGKTFVRRRGTTPLPNATVHDSRLSYAALGLLAVLLARPVAAPSGYRDLMGRGLGQDATLRALRELTDAGYRHQVRRTGARGRIVTDTVVSEEPITVEQAQDWLAEGLWKADATVRGNPTHGATSRKSASAQVAPRGASPEPGRPEPGQPPHVLRTQGDLGTSSLVTGDTTAHAKAECPHGMPGGLAPTKAGTPRCPLCRRTPEPALVPAGADYRARAAGEHLEDA